MRIVEINSVPYGSTAKIMLGIADVAEKHGHEVMMAGGYSYHPLDALQGRYTQIGGVVGKLMHTYLARFTGLNGCFSRHSTRKFLKQVKKYNPDVLHLHNIHGWYLHLPTLFSFIKKQNVRVVWTLHDCWSFTGQCPHFDKIGCEKWKTGCYKCPQLRSYPQTYVDRSKGMYARKKKWFTGVQDLTIVTPSQWLADLVKESFLGEYPVQVIHNGIDLSAFQPVESDWRKRYGVEDKRLLLGVAMGWSESKGLDVFIELAKRLDEQYKIVLVGTNEETDKLLPENILSIHRTQNQQELTELYAAADVLVNPTREDTFPTVNIEALACGTPVLTFKTGGSPEILDETCGSVVEKNDVDALQREIERICTEKPYSMGACTSRAAQFNKDEKFEEYVKLYKKD